MFTCSLWINACLNNNLNFKILSEYVFPTSVDIHIMVSRVMTPDNLVFTKCFGRIYRFHLHGIPNMYGLCYSETFVSHTKVRNVIIWKTTTQNVKVWKLLSVLTSLYRGSEEQLWLFLLASGFLFVADGNTVVRLNLISVSCRVVGVCTHFAPWL